MKLEKKFTLGDLIALGLLVVVVVFGWLESCGIRSQIQLLEESQQPYFIGSATWSCSFSLRKGEDIVLFMPEERDYVANTSKWAEAAQHEPYELTYYVWVAVENTGSSTAAAEYIDVSYEWQGKQLEETTELNRYIRPGDRLFVLLLVVDGATVGGDLTSYLWENLELHEDSCRLRFRYPVARGESLSQIIWPLPILGPPALQKQSPPGSEL